MATLTGNTIASTYALLLKIDSTGIAGDGTLRKVEDGDATDSALSLSDVSIAVDATDKIFLDGGTHSYIHESASDVVQIVAGGTVVFEGDTNSRISLSNNDGGTSNTLFGSKAGANLTTNGDYNILIGEDAGNDLTTGTQNVAIGFGAFDNATTDADNNIAIGLYAMGGVVGEAVLNCVAIGIQAMDDVLEAGASGSVAIGAQALGALTSGIGNVAIGYQSLDANQTSDYNTAVGHQSLSAVTADGSAHNTALGYQAGLSIAGGTHNTCIGSFAGNLMDGETGNTFVGYYAGGEVNHGAIDCVAIGHTAMGTAEATQAGSVAIGKSALTALTSGDGNVAVGYTAGAALTDGQYNTLLGYEAGLSLDGGTSNVFVGWKAGRVQVEAGHCIAIGHYALSNSSNTSSVNNIAIGSNSLDAITDGVATGNVCIGFDTGTAITIGDYNTCIGTDAGKAVNTGLSNTFVGAFAGDATDDGSENTAVGMAALSANCGNSNTAIGKDAGEVITGNGNTVMGKSAGKVISSGSNNLFLGEDSGLTGSPGGAITTGGNEIVLGDENITESHIQVDWTVASDERDKTDFTALDIGLDFVKELSPVTYKWDKRSKYGDKTADDYDLADQTPDGTHKEDWLDIGFKAQEVEALEKAAGYKIADKTNLTTSITGDGKQYGIQYSKFVPILVKAVQELSAKVEELEAKLK